MIDEYIKQLNKKNGGQKFEKCPVNNLEDIGREQFFGHYPKSNLPIRDVASKTEPHIEIGAENYLRNCYQPNIKSFCHSSEKYLFLCTTCKNQEIGNGKFFKKRFIVGYIEKKGWMKMSDDHLAVIGRTYIIPFDEKLEYGNLKIKRSRGMQKFNGEDTKKLLRLIHLHQDITAECMKEMIVKEKQTGENIPIDTECLSLKKMCEFKSDCLRRKLQ